MFHIKKEKRKKKKPSFSILKWGARGLRLHGCVIKMQLSQNRVVLVKVSFEVRLDKTYFRFPIGRKKRV